MITIFILTILLIISLYVNWNLYRKVGILEKYATKFLSELTNLKQRIEVASKVMNEADIRGSFSSDDEVGSAFKIIKDCIDYMNSQLDDLNEYDTKQ